MFDLLILLIGFSGFGLAGYLDLKTTEFPSWIPFSIMSSVLAIRVINSFYLQSFAILMESIFTGILFLSIGLSLYFLKKWADGDAWLLGSLGFLLPNSFVKSPSFFPVQLHAIIVFLLSSFFYIIAYYLILGAGDKKLKTVLSKSITAKKITIALILSLFFPISFVSFPFFSIIGPYFILLSLVCVLSALFLDYSGKVEAALFKKNSSSKKIKTGVRFAPAYFLTLLFLVFL